MGRPNFQGLQAQKAPVLARVGTPNSIVKKKELGFGRGRGGFGINRGLNRSQQFKSLGNQLVIDQGIVGGRGRGRGRGGGKTRG